MPVIGWLSGAAAGPFAHFAASFRQGLAEVGFVEGRNVAIEYHWMDGQLQRLPEVAADLVNRKVSIIAASAGIGPAIAAKAATTTIPIVFVAGTDPVMSGLVPNCNRPGGNITGAYWFTTTLEPKRFGLARDMVPGAALIGALVNPNRPAVSQHQAKQLEEAAQAVGQRILILRASNEAEMTSAFGTFEREQVAADRGYRRSVLQLTEEPPDGASAAAPAPIDLRNPRFRGSRGPYELRPEPSRDVSHRGQLRGPHS